MMKKKPLILAAIAVIGIGVALNYATRDNNPTIPNTTTPPVSTSEQVVAKVPTHAELEARIQSYDQALTNAYKPFLSRLNYATNFSLSSDKLVFSDQQATSTTTLSISLTSLVDIQPMNNLMLRFHNIITYNNDLIKQGIIAHIHSTPIIDDVIKKNYDIDEKDVQKIQQMMDLFSINTDLMADGKVEQTITIKPVKTDEEYSFEGATFSSSFNEKTISTGSATMHASIGAYQDNDGNALKPFTIDYNLDTDGNLKINTTPISAQVDNGENVLSIDNIDINGKNLTFDFDAGILLGQINLTIKEIDLARLSHKDKPIRISNILLTSNNYKKDNLYDGSSNLEIKIDGQSITDNIPDFPLHLNTAKLDLTAENTPLSLYQLINHIQKYISEHPQARSNALEMIKYHRADINQAISDMVHNLMGIKVNASLHTDEGTASIKSAIAFQEHAPASLEAWEQAFNNLKSPFEAANLIKNTFSFAVHIEVPQSIIDAAGLQDEINRSLGYIIKDGDYYKFDLKNNDKNILLNGNPLPLPQ